jgi:hypothetical protein
MRLKALIIKGQRCCPFYLEQRLGVRSCVGFLMGKKVFLALFLANKKK